LSLNKYQPLHTSKRPTCRTQYISNVYTHIHKLDLCASNENDARHMHMCNALYIPHRDRSVLNRYQTCRHMCLCTRPVCIERDLGKAHLHVYICSYVHMYPLTEEETYTHSRGRTLIYPLTEEDIYIPIHGGGDLYTHSRRIYPLTEETLRLQIFGSPDLCGFPAHSLSDGDSVYSRENLFQILGTPATTCWTPVARSKVLEGKVSRFSEYA